MPVQIKDDQVHLPVIVTGPFGRVHSKDVMPTVEFDTRGIIQRTRMKVMRRWATATIRLTYEDIGKLALHWLKQADWEKMRKMACC